VSETGPGVYCPRCGAPLVAGAQFCSKCGVAMPKSSENAGDPPAYAALPARGGLPAWAIVLIVVVVLGLVAIPIIAILAAIMIPNFVRARDEAKTAVDEANLKAIATALEGYAVDNNGAYPKTLKPLAPKYIAALPSVPQSGKAYVYYLAPPDKRFGAYEIADDGTADPTTTRLLTKGPGGPLCAGECKTIVYAQNAGIVGAP
jgi:type II secretory pathway pseudopilin PulG